MSVKSLDATKQAGRPFGDFSERGSPQESFMEKLLQGDNMFEILPVAMTVVDWPKFVGGSNRMISRSPTRGLDAAGIPVGTPFSFIPALEEFRRKNSSGRTHDRAILEHMTFSFLVSTDGEILKQISINTKLSILLSDPGRNKENYILTGTLAVWQASIITACDVDSNIESREFFNAIWDFFNSIGFSEIFSDYRRKNLKDNTWILEHRK